MSDPTVALLHIIFPDKIWLASICQKYPNIKIEIQSFLPGNPTAGKEMVGNALMKLHDARIDAVLADIQAHPSLVELFVLAKDVEEALVNVKTRDSWLLASLIAAEVVLRFPVKVGWDGNHAVGTWTITGMRDRVDHLLTLLEEKHVLVELKSIQKIQSNQIQGTLTPRQAEILELALKLGYFEFPRRINLTDLAKHVGVAKSTLSEIVRRISQKKVQS